ncbi:MAG: tetratricopeptide repeat protein [Candidatus Omnitrophica bacterium]|nr:tetratricopeptide repeat protein [Candidatus Omnitrophota bacterium]
MAGGYFTGLLLVFDLIVIGIQAWYILSIKVDGEIGNLRFVFLLLISLLSLLVVITPFVGARVAPNFLILIFLFLPVLSLKASQFWEKKQGEAIEAAAIQEEIGKWEYTIQKDPEHTGAYIRMGELHLRRGEKDKALAYYKKALSLRPDDPGIIEQICFIEKKMEMMPKLTKSDLGIVKAEFKKFPLVFGLAIGALFFIYLLSLLPTSVQIILVILVPVVLFFRWVMKP